MEGFFNKAATGAFDQQAVRRKRVGCGLCGLYKNCNSPKMEPSGKGEKGLLVIARAPGKTEDRLNKHLMGKDGKRLRRVLKEKGINLDRDARVLHAIACRPPDDQEPQPEQIECCRDRVWKEIETYKPKSILLLGSAALESFLIPRWSGASAEGKLNLSKWRGFCIPDREANAWATSTYHPSYIDSRRKRTPVLEKIWLQDIERAVKALEIPMPVSQDDSKFVEIIKKPRLINYRLRDIANGTFGWASFDYETTGLKPHAEGHKIVTCSFAVTPERAIAFPISPEVEDMTRAVLRNPDINKIAHNLKFEEAWSRVRLGTRVASWGWDSMLAAHVLDNRKFITGLKMQTYINFGVPDYDSRVAPFLNSGSKNANAFNRIFEADMDDLLLYNGLDSIYGFRLAMKQMQEMGFTE